MAGLFGAALLAISTDRMLLVDWAGLDEVNLLNEFALDCPTLRFVPKSARSAAALITEELCRTVLAAAEGTGARGLVTILDDVLRDFKFELPSHKSIKVLEVDAETVRNPQAKLEAILDYGL